MIYSHSILKTIIKSKDYKIKQLLFLLLISLDHIYFASSLDPPISSGLRTNLIFFLSYHSHTLNKFQIISATIQFLKCRWFGEFIKDTKKKKIKNCILEQVLIIYVRSWCGDASAYLSGVRFSMSESNPSTHATSKTSRVLPAIYNRTRSVVIEKSTHQVWAPHT